MIEVSAGVVFLIYLGICLAIVLCAWVWHEVRAAKRRIVPPEFARIVCEYCATGYITPSNKPVARCPSCQSLNRAAASSERIRPKQAN